MRKPAVPAFSFGPKSPFFGPFLLESPFFLKKEAPAEEKLFVGKKTIFEPLGKEERLRFFPWAFFEKAQKKGSF
jgi:hypothetical protein